MNEIPSGGQIKTVNITISRDAISEPAEQLVVVVSNVTGGASLPIASSPLKVRPLSTTIVDDQHFQPMPGGTYDRTYAYPHMCKIPIASEKSPVPPSLATVQHAKYELCCCNCNASDCHPLLS